jgi:hypothetical protein
MLVDEQDGVLAGHGRLLAARQLGLDEVPVIRFEHFSEAQKRAYLIADNQLALQAGWSEELLAQELVWLREERFDLDLIGFDAGEIERLLALADGEAGSDEVEDDVPEPPEDPVSRPGDLWILGNHRLLCGEGQPREAEYACVHCGALIGERHKTWMLEHGAWQPTAPGDGRTAGFHLSSLYSPVGWFSWADAAEMYEQAKKAPDLMKGLQLLLRNRRRR